MFSLRSLLAFTVSVLIHGSVVAYLISHNANEEKPEPKKIAMQVSMFKIAPTPAKPIIKTTTPTPITPAETLTEEKRIKVKPIPVADEKPTIEKVAVVEPKPAIEVIPKLKVKPVIKKTIKKKIKPKKVITKKKAKAKPTKKTPPKKKIVVKKRVTPKTLPTRHVSKRIVPAQRQSKTTPFTKTKPVSRPVSKPKTASNPQIEKQYGLSIRQRIEQKKAYPRRAKRMRKQGLVKVGFQINRNGTISKLRIVLSSGIKSLDKGAIQAVRKVGRFPEFPVGIHKEFINYIIPLSYHLRQ